MLVSATVISHFSASVAPDPLGEALGDRDFGGAVSVEVQFLGKMSENTVRSE